MTNSIPHQKLLPLWADWNNFMIYVHLFLKATPTVPVHLIVKNLKAISSRILRNEYPLLKHRLNTLWTRSYYCETIGCISEEAIRKYIENQKNV